MSITTLVQAKAQLRVTTDDEDTLYQTYLDAAEDWASSYCNRYFYPDADTLQAAVDAVPAMLTAAETAWQAAMAQYPITMHHSVVNDINREAANATFTRACNVARMTYAGMVPPARFTQAILLLISSSDANREALFTAMPTAVDPPFGVTDLLFGLRAQLGV